jgi:hypothetical protein
LTGIFFGSASCRRFCLGGILLIADGMLSLFSRCLLRLLLITDHISFRFTLIHHYDHASDYANDANDRHDRANDDDDANVLNDNLL